MTTASSRTGSAGRRFVAAAAALVVLGALLGALSAAERPATPVARAEIAFGVTADEDSAQRAVRTQLALLTGRGVLDRVAAQLDVPLEDLQRSVRAEVLPDSTVIRVEARAATEDAALRTVSVLVDEYVVTNFLADFPLHALMTAQLAVPPYLPVGPTEPGPPAGAGLGAAFGLLVAAGASWLRTPGTRGGAVR
jgi:hypothetical protein